MENNVILTIVGNKFMDDDEQMVELITQGRYYKKGDAVVLEYEESEISGMEGTVTRMLMENRTVTMKREGRVSSHFVFKNNQYYMGYYNTPAGKLEVGLFPTYVDYKLREDSGHIDLEYRLEVAGIETMNQIFVEYKQASAGNAE